MPTVELQISALPVHVRTARLIAAALGRRIGLDAVVIDEVKLAVGEACSRAVSVHRAAKLLEPIVVAFRDDNDILEIAVSDCGPDGAQFLPSQASDIDRAAPSEAAEAAAEVLLTSAARAAQEPADLGREFDVASLAPGLGLAVIAGLVDDVSVDARSKSPKRPAGTTVTMRWPIVTF